MAQPYANKQPRKSFLNPLKSEELHGAFDSYILTMQYISFCEKILNSF